MEQQAQIQYFTKKKISNLCWKHFKVNEIKCILYLKCYTSWEKKRKKRRRHFSIFLHHISYLSISVEHQVMDGGTRVEKFFFQRAVLQFHSCLLPSLKHLEMLWSRAGYCIKITICLMRYSSSAAPTILLQTVTSSSCLGGSYKKLLCKPKLCSRGNRFF